MNSAVYNWRETGMDQSAFSDKNDHIDPFKIIV